MQIMGFAKSITRVLRLEPDSPPGGEWFASLQQRVIDFANSLIPLPAVALVAHAGVLRALVGHWQQLPVAEWTQLQFDFGSLTTIQIDHAN